MTDFKSLIIPEEIIIVENSSHQGFVVDPENKKVLETALSWAEGYIYGEGDTWEERKKNGHPWEPIVNKYKNGTFKLRLNKSAGLSNNGGKLSFWNCDIIAPDDKVYLVGINQELLLHLLMNCTLKNGEVQELIWLGKQKGNTGVYTENMDEINEAKEELLRRQLATKKTKSYKPGDLVGNLTSKYVYLGEFKKVLDININHYYYSWDSNKIKVNISRVTSNESPKYLYLNISAECKDTYDTDIYSFKTRDTKTALTLYEKNYSDITLDKYKDNILQSHMSQFSYNRLASILEYYDLDFTDILATLNSKFPEYEFVF